MTARASRLSRFATVWAGLVLVFWAWSARTSRGVIDLDLWHELALARETATLGFVPHVDSYAYTPTISPVVDHEWGAGVIGYCALSLAGAGGIIALTLGTLALACFVAVACAYWQNADERMVAIAGLLMAPLFTMGSQPVRAQAYSWVFFAILLFAIELDKRGIRWALPAWCPVFVLWVNCHASFVLAFAVLSLYWLSAVWQRKRNLPILGWIALSALLIAVNPFGLAIYPYLWRTLRLARPFVEEWAPAWHGRFAPLLRPMLVSLALVLYAGWQRRSDFQAVGTILLMAAGALLHVKLMPYYAVAFLAAFPAVFEATAIGSRVKSILTVNRMACWITWACIMAAASVALVFLRFWTVQVPDHGDVEATYPVGAVEYLAQQSFQGKLMTPFNEGAYVSWKLWPRVRISMDSRYDVAFPEWLIPVNERAYATGDWRGFVTTYPTDMILVHRNSVIENSLASAWKPAYRDAAYALFERPGLDLPAVDYGSRTFRGTLP